MNARRDRFVKPSRRFAAPIKALRLGVCAAGVAATAGCAGGVANPFATAPVDPASPIAAEVAATAASNKAFPSFNDIPKAPTDQRPAKAWGQAATQVEAARDKLERETAPETWSLSGTEAFAAQAARDSGQGEAPDAASDTEAFADSARRRATPPPSPR